MRDAREIWPYVCSRDCRYVLDELARIGNSHNVDIPNQVLGDIMDLELTVYQFPAQSVCTVIKDFFPKWKKSVDAGKKVTNGTLIRYYTTPMRPMGDGKSIRESSRIRNLVGLKLSKWIDIYVVLTREFAQADITTSELQQIIQLACGGEDSLMILAGIRDAMNFMLQDGKTSVAYLMAILPTYIVKAEMKLKKAQYQTSLEIQLPTANEDIKPMSKQESDEMWEATKMRDDFLID